MNLATLRTILSLDSLSSPTFTTLVRLLTPLATAVGTFAFYKLVLFVWREWITNPLNDLPGPSSPSFLYGNMRQISDAEDSVMHEEWVKSHGNTIRYKAFLGMSRLFTMDLKAINHVLMNSQTYEKPEQSRIFLSRLLGDGVLVVEGAKHKQQRKVMNPAFGPSQTRELTEIFVDKALELRDVWTAELRQQNVHDTREKHPARINVLTGLSKMTLDVIGLAGFGYKFGSLRGERSELNEAFNAMFSAPPAVSALFVLQGLLWRLGFIVSLEDDKARREARAKMDRIGKQLLIDSKSVLENISATRSEKDGRFNRKDLLSLLVRANMSTEVPESQKMSDEDVLAQVPTFLVAGHETTSNATTWGLYALSQNLDVQTKLREELFTIETDNPTMDELNSLPYLDAIVRETLRVYAPVSGTVRVAVKDDVLPLGTPFVDKKGRVQDSIIVRKGQTIFIPILAINRSEELWGQDAREFRPERWVSIPEGASAVPGVWGNMLTFIGGPRSCIGYRFALVEMKALLFTLVRSFEYKLAVAPEDIGRKTSIVQRPFLISDPQAGSQMPLLVSPYVRVD